MAEQTDVVRVLLVGTAGKMGLELVKALTSTQDLKLVAGVSPRHAGHDVGVLAGIGASGVLVDADLEEAIQRTSPDVLVDFTNPVAVYAVAQTAIRLGVRPVIGSTGLSAEQVSHLTYLCAEAGLGGVLAPNFSLGAILLMAFAKQAARYFEFAEIIEKHHERKLDAPSGTALSTAEALGQVRKNFNPGLPDSRELLAGVRGGQVDGVRIHSVRMPGLLAHQEVLFGAEGQLLTLRHDATHRACYIPGVCLAIRAVMRQNTLIVGLENLLFEDSRT